LRWSRECVAATWAEPLLNQPALTSRYQLLSYHRAGFAGARRIPQPALAVLGTASPPMFAERQKLLLHWLPNAEPLDLPGLTHLLQAQDPAAVAGGLAGFFARHPIPEPL